MENSNTYQFVAGNTETVGIVDLDASKTFWSEYFTESNTSEEEDDDSFIECSIDLMGNPISTKSAKK